MQYIQNEPTSDSELIESPYITYDECVYKTDIPFLADYTLGDLMILKNMEFQIASKCYIWKQQLRRNPTWDFAQTIIDPELWLPDSSRTYYSKIVHIRAVLEFIRSSDIDMLQWMYQVNKNLRGPFFWLYNLQDLIAKQSRIFTSYVLNWRFTMAAMIATEERKRIKEFQWLLKEKFGQFHFYENGIIFNILRYIFTFAQTNRNPFFFPVAKRKYSELLCEEVWSDDETSVKELKIIN